jgi:LmbE family N-acetylglucosaminyl deacetylase
MNKILLVVAAHPDDEVLGCAGTVARLIGEGYTAYSLILGKGLGARGTIDSEALVVLQSEMQSANSLLGIKEVFNCDFPDNAFDSVPLLEIVQAVEQIVHKVQPELIFTHFREDLNIDHQLTYKAVLTATRPMKGQCVKEIYSFEVPSSTEWNFPNKFCPNVFFEISIQMDQKCAVCEAYAHEMRDYPHPRSIEHLKENAKNWGSKIGVRYAEAFECVRILR